MAPRHVARSWKVGQYPSRVDQVDRDFGIPRDHSDGSIGSAAAIGLPGGARGDLDAAAGPYDRAISQNLDNAEAYFLKARNLTYLRGKLALLDR